MTFGIIGAGGIGKAFARQLVRIGVGAMVSNSRGPESLAPLRKELGPKIRPVTTREAAAADIVMLSVVWNKIGSTVAGLPDWGGRIVIDAMNPVIMPEFKFAELGGRASSEIVAEQLSGARVVKSLNTLSPEILGADPHQNGGRRVMFMSGDDADAKETLAKLLERIGFAPIDIGGLAASRLQQFPGGTLPGLNLIRLG